MTIPELLFALAKLRASGRASEHSCRGDLQQLLSSLCLGDSIINEPGRIDSEAPDYILAKKDILVGYQSARKWLKEWMGRQLIFDNIRHYKRMIVTLTETGK